MTRVILQGAAILLAVLWAHLAGEYTVGSAYALGSHERTRRRRASRRYGLLAALATAAAVIL